MSNIRRQLRVAQWATGNVGLRSLRAVIEHPDLELVAVHVHSPDKIGRDAGQLCGLPETGVLATGTIEAVLAAAPDCVLYMPDVTRRDEILQLLSSGINIVTTRGDFHHPGGMDPTFRAEVESACIAGNASIHSSGSSPGFVSEALPIVLTSLSRRLDCLTIDEFADLSSRNSPEMLFQGMGFGGEPGPLTGATLDHVKAGYTDTLLMTATAFGIKIDEIVVDGAFAPARTDTSIAAGMIRAGRAAAQRVTVSAVADGRPRLRFRANWYCTRDVDADWDFRASGWRILLEGDTPLDVSITFPVQPEDYAAFTPNLTAHRPVNAVPVVCAAAPGIRTTNDLAQIVAVLS